MQIAIITIVISMLFLISGLCVGIILPCIVIVKSLVHRDKCILKLIENITGLKLIQESKIDPEWQEIYLRRFK